MPISGRSVSMRGDNTNNFNSVAGVAVNQQHGGTQSQQNYGQGPQANNAGKTSMRSMTLQNQGAFAVGVSGFSVTKSRDFNHNNN